MHNCPFQFWTSRFMGPVDFCGSRDSGPAAPPSRGAWCRQLRRIHLRPFIWDHFIWDHIHLTKHLRPIHLSPHWFATTFIWDLFIWGHIHMILFHLRPHLFETTFICVTTIIWNHSHLRPHWFETIHMRRYSIVTTFIWDHIHFTPRWSEAVLIYCELQKDLFFSRFIFQLKTESIVSPR